MKTNFGFLVLMMLPCLLAGAQDTVFESSFETRTVEISFTFSETTSNGQGELVSAAFHDISPIDVFGRRFSTVDVATEKGHQYQVDGWFTDLPNDEVGTMAWAAQSATLSIPVPETTEGIIFTVLGAVHGQLAEVTVDGVPTTPLRVDDYWHEAYVPIVEPVPEQLPEPAVRWFANRYFPQLPESGRFYSIKVRSGLNEFALPREESFRLNQSYLATMSLTLVGMQGIINRHTPRVYLDWDNWHDADEIYLEELRPLAEVIELDLDPLSAVNFLWRRYGQLFDGAVIYDPEIAHTINLATMYAGVEDRLILSPDQLDMPGVPVPGDQLDLVEFAKDYDNSDESQRQIYEAAYQSLWPRLEHRIIGVISPGPPVSGDDFSPNRNYPIAMAERDWYIALKLPAFYIDPYNEPLQAALWNTMLDEPTAKPKVITGVYRNNEAKIVDTAAEKGYWLAGISWPGFTLEAGNLSLLGGVRPNPRRYQPRISADRIMRSLSARHVATLWTPDGDHYTAHNQYAILFPNLVPEPMGYTVEPWFMELAPAVWNYFVDRDPSDRISMLAGFSGNGYTLPLLMDDEERGRYLDKVAVGLNRSGLNVVYFDDRGKPIPDGVVAQYYDKLSGSGYLGSLGSGLTSGKRTSLVYGGVPAPFFRLDHMLPEDDSYIAVVESLMSEPDPGNFLIEYEEAHIRFGQMVADADASGGESLEVPPTIQSDPSCCAAAWMEPLSLPPGDYEVSVRLKVSDNSGPTDGVNVIAIEQGSSDPNALSASQAMNPSDFAAPGVYQDLTFPFSLDHLAASVDIILEYRGGAGTLNVDLLGIVRSGERIVPFSTVRHRAGYAFPGEDDYDRSSTFVDAFEAAGGVFLYPEEFMGSLNPEFMIDFARQQLPDGSPLIDEAESELADGHFFNAVLKVREALLAAGPGQGRAAE